MNKALYSLLFCLAFLSCSQKRIENKYPKSGIWRAIIDVQGHELPFNFELIEDQGLYSISIHNAKERLLLEDIKFEGDSMTIPMHIFDATVKVLFSETSLKGTWTKHYVQDYVLPFRAEFGSLSRFEKGNSSSISVNGKWRIKFSTEEVDSVFAVGDFAQKGNIVTGSILTATGDYRFLEGQVVDSTLMLSTFDGAHAFVFKAKLNSKNQLIGDFWSGKTWHETWAAKRDKNARLPVAESLTFLKEGYTKIEFEFPDLEGNLVNLNADRFKNNVVILQIFGTWCPNCMDETIFLSNWYQRNNSRDVEIIGLAYEAKDDFNYAKRRVEIMKNKLNVNYDFLIAGVYDKVEAAKTLPMLNHILSFPTTIFIDKKGQVRRIHTGFTGPGTGEYYTQFVEDFERFTNTMIEE